ncbi:MAG: hypothetical protein U5K69_08515 [Balneolaceae bacterium]|nr:hypothetical protein [Balneolaceae bacterium]
MSERFPKSGSLGIVLLIGLGFLAAGGSNAIMGEIADGYLPEGLNEQRAASVLERVEERFPQYVQKAEEASMQELAQLGYREVDVENALSLTRQALDYYRSNKAFNGTLTGKCVACYC